MSKTPFPSGLVTFMFTDIVGSTNMKSKMPGATSGERQENFRQKIKEPHDAIITERVSARGGRMIKSTGDGFFVAFADAEKAVLCAVEIQQRINEASIFTPDGVLQIRIGLNSGQANPVSNDYTASAADKAARVENKATCGQVYLSRETHELICGKVRGISTASAGNHDLKDVACEELFVAFLAGSSVVVSTPAVPHAKPAQSKVSNNLPPLFSFFGREKELKIIADALAPEARTWGALIDGPGGMGKTSLAVRAAELVPPNRFKQIIFLSAKERELTADGQRPLKGFVLPSYLQMLNELANQLGQPELAKLAEEERTLRLQQKLQTAEALLIFDNLESLSSEHRDQLFAFVGRLPHGCKAIVTSRRRTDVDARIIRLEKLDQKAALELLAELAQDRPLLAKATEQERLHLYEETGGNPLLLRWIAGQLGKGRCRTIASALEFIRSAPSGNDPLEFIFGDLLETFTETETKVLAALAHFTSKVEVKFIAELAEVSNGAAQTALGDLANRALVIPDEEEKNFSLVPMVADFLRNKRPEVVNGTGSRLEKRAYALIVENGYDKHERFPVLEAAWPSVAPALPRFLAGPNDRLQTVCSALQAFLNFTGRWDEWLALSQQAEAKAAAAGDHYNAGWRTYHAGMIHCFRGQADAVLACADRAAAHWEKVLPKAKGAQAGTRERATAIQLRGQGHQLKKDYPAAIAAYGEVVGLYRSLSAESADVAIALNSLAGAERFAKDFAAAERDYREALRVACAVGDAEGVAIYTGNLAALALDQKDWPGGEKMAREALPLSEKVGRQETIALDCHRLACALVRQGKGMEGLPYAWRAVEIFTRLGTPNLESARATLRECESQ
jgi:class 3 adenylate cyclase